MMLPHKCIFAGPDDCSFPSIIPLFARAALSFLIMVVFHYILEPNIKINLIECIIFILIIILYLIMIIFVKILFIVIIGRSSSIIKFEVLQI